MELQRIINALKEFCDVTACVDQLEALKQQSIAARVERTAYAARLQRIAAEWADVANELDAIYRWISDCQQEIESIDGNDDWSLEEKLNRQKVCGFVYTGIYNIYNIYKCSVLLCK